MTDDQPPADLSTTEDDVARTDRIFAEATGADIELAKLATMLRVESNTWFGRDPAAYRSLCRTLGYVARQLDAHRCGGTSEPEALPEEEARARHAGFLAAVAETDQAIAEAVERDKRLGRA